jgi:hypothetical protein
MKRANSLLMSLLLTLAACLPIQAEKPGETLNSPVVSTPVRTATLPVGDQPYKLDSQTVERVEFEPSVTSITRSGSLAEGGDKEYMFSGAAVQNIHIQTVGYTAPVHFTLRSPRGKTWSGKMQASDVYIIAMQVVLPEDGNYVVTLFVPPGAGATPYDITFTIGGYLPADPPERVEFTPGASSAQYSGILPSSYSIKQYALAASRGQTMTVDVTSKDVLISLTITSPGWIQLFSEVPSNDGSFHISSSFTLTEIGDYLITLTKAEHTPSTQYTVDFTIR